MGHSLKSNRKIVKQINKCDEVKELKKLTKGYMIVLKNGLQFACHFDTRGAHNIRRFMKKNTCLKNLKW